MKPSIGRIVHYVPTAEIGADPERHYAAIVTHVWSDTTVNLNVFPSGISVLDATVGGVVQSATLDEKFGDHSWHWPEQVSEEASAVPSHQTAPSKK